MRRNDKRHQPSYKPKIIYEEFPIAAEGTDHTSIWKDSFEDRFFKKPNYLRNPDDAIKYRDTERQWARSDFNVGDHFDHTRLNTLDKYTRFYHGNQFVRYDHPLPLFVPSNKIYINSPRGVEEQWRLFAQKTGLTRAQHQQCWALITARLQHHRHAVITLYSCRNVKYGAVTAPYSCCNVKYGAVNGAVLVPYLRIRHRYIVSTAQLRRSYGAVFHAVIMM
jgi:hypothetical protein